ncbi:hypothetical protein PQX77_005352 [Marasmius sp. AFHP31]|nr:hypothetical protein PQX77_005352 [Marasmius sp. AFHP31]
MDHREQYKRVSEARGDEVKQCLDAMDVDAADTPSIRALSPPPAANSSRSSLLPPLPPADNNHERVVTTTSKQRAREVPVLIIPSTNSLDAFALPLSSELFGLSTDTGDSGLSLNASRVLCRSPEDQSPATSYTASSGSPESAFLSQVPWDRAAGPHLQMVSHDTTYDMGPSGPFDPRNQISKMAPSGCQYGADCNSFDDNGLYILEETKYLTDGMSDLTQGSPTEYIYCKEEEVFRDLGSPITGDTPSSHAYGWPSFDPLMVRAATGMNVSSASDSTASSSFPVCGPNIALTTAVSCPSNMEQYPQYTPSTPIEYSPNTPDRQQQRLRTVEDIAITRASRMRREKPNIHQCPYCESTFTALHNLKNHVNSHLGMKPHTCERCGQSFGTRHVLARHSKKLCGI